MPHARWTEKHLPDLSGRTVVITGATSGIGLVMTRALARAGANVTLAVRDMERGTAIAADIPGRTDVRHLDVADLTSVRAFAELWNHPLDILINNAGIMKPTYGRSADGFELHMATNHLGPFLLTTLLLPQVTNRVVSVSSQLHRRARLDLTDLGGTAHRLSPMRAYANSKLANILVTFELQHRLTEAGSPVRALLAHPGIARTNLVNDYHGPQAVLSRLTAPLFNDAATGALPIEYAAATDAPGGSYVGPNGLGHLRGYPTVHDPSRNARDPELARQVWDLSVQLTSEAGADREKATTVGSSIPKGTAPS